MSFDRTPPHDDIVEKSTLGALLLDEDAIGIAIQYLRPFDFYSKANSLIYEAILTLFNKGSKADILTVIGQLRQAGTLDQAGGPAYVASLTDVVPSSANIEYYAQVVQDCSLKRALIKTSNKVISQCYDESQDARMILEEAQQQIFELNDRRQTLTFKSAGEVVKETINAIERIYNTKKEYTGVPSGFDDLDRLTGGFQQQELIIIGARPSMGKTALALSMVANMSIHNQRGNIPVAFFTLEMSDISLMLRVISSESNVDSQKIRTGFISTDDFHRITETAAVIYEAPFYIVDKPNMKLLDLRALARRLRMQHKVEVIFIDYLTLINSENHSLQRHEQIAEISRALKSLARELDIPVIALSQLTRDAEKDRPNLSSIRESGAIEQDADVVIFLHRERDSDQKIEEQENKEGSTTHLILAKQRNGPVGTIDILFKSRFTKFVSLIKRE